MQLPGQQPSPSGGGPAGDRSGRQRDCRRRRHRGVEAPGNRFCIGVQWHPENFWQTGEFRPLFEEFVNAARERLPAMSPLEDA